MIFNTCRDDPRSDHGLLRCPGICGCGKCRLWNSLGCLVHNENSAPSFPLEVGSDGHFYDIGSLDFGGLCHVSIDNLADSGLLCFQSIPCGHFLCVVLCDCDFVLGLFHGETNLVVINEPALDNGEGGISIDDFLKLCLLELGALDFNIVHHQLKVQTLVGLLGGLLLGGNDGKAIGGTGFHAGDQFLFQSGVGNTGLGKSNIGADNLLVDMVKGESELFGSPDKESTTYRFRAMCFLFCEKSGFPLQKSLRRR